jgi:hypothetical protein
MAFGKMTVRRTSEFLWVSLAEAVARAKRLQRPTMWQSGRKYGGFMSGKYPIDGDRTLLT